MNKLLILNKLKQHYNFKTNADFANFLGISAQALSNWLSRSTFDYDILYTKCLDINTEWLFTGEGSMLKGESTNNNLAKKTEIDSKEGIPLIPISAFAGIARGEHTIMEYDCERYIVPLFKDAEFLIPVKGESMTPRYNSGDIVACKKLPLTDVFFQWNKVYVIDTDQGVLVKRIKQGSTPEQLKIISENPEYDPFELKLSQIHALAIVIGVIRLE